MDFTLLLVILIIIAVISYYYKLPKRDSIVTDDLPSSYMIQTLNRMDIQHNNECAAFSSAYILRHLGVEAEGYELYKKYPRKLFDGTVSPKGIIVFFKNLGLDVSFYYGNIDSLKKQLTKGTPVILFIRVFPKKRYLHFVPAIGYDENYIYLADSLKHTINCSDSHYNRKILITDLEVLWKTWLPFHTNSYLVIHSCRFNKNDRTKSTQG